MINDLLAIKQGSTDYKNVNLKALIKNTILVKIGLHCRYKRRGQAGSHHEFTNNNFAFHESQNK